MHPIGIARLNLLQIQFSQAEILSQARPVESLRAIIASCNQRTRLRDLSLYPGDVSLRILAPQSQKQLLITQLKNLSFSTPLGNFQKQ
jgi:hypothetical protein